MEIPKIKKLAKGEALMLRTCNPDGSSHGGFMWPKSGHVSCSDWKSTPNCGNGLHGLLWGEGDADYLNWDNAAWLAVRVKLSEVVDISRKVKVSSGIVEYFGDKEIAVALIQAHAPSGKVIVGGTATAGYEGTATAGDRGTATAGDRGTATAGYEGTATAGDRGTATAGDEGTATAGDRGTATAGYRGTATAGYEGTATAGDRGTATAGDRGTATAGDEGTATAGYEGTISILYYNGQKYKRAVFAVGTDEGELEPNQPYTVNSNGKAVKGVKP